MKKFLLSILLWFITIFKKEAMFKVDTIVLPKINYEIDGIIANVCSGTKRLDDSREEIKRLIRDEIVKLLKVESNVD